MSLWIRLCNHTYIHTYIHTYVNVNYLHLHLHTYVHTYNTFKIKNAMNAYASCFILVKIRSAGKMAY